MATAAPDHPGLADLVDLAAQLRADEERQTAALHRRDRAIGRELDELRNKPAQQLTAWLHRVQEQDAALPGMRARQAQQVGGLLVLALGLVLGWLTAAAVFYYDGSQPVNVVHVLAVFVVLQVVLLALTAVASLPRGAVAWLPGAATALDALRLLSPGRLLLLAKRFLPASYREGLERAMGSGRAYDRVYGRVQKWAVLLWSQGFAVAFHAGALLGCLYLIVFSDLAFGWSTTVQALDAPTFHRITRAIAWPWAGWWPAAAPSVELIAATRYYRIDEGVLGPAGGPAVDPAVFGGWWPFLVAAMVTYGLLPRVVTLVVAQWRYRAAVRWTMLHTPGAAQLLDRLNTELVETQATEPEAGGAAMAEGVEAPPAQLVASMPYRVINWAGVPLSDDGAAALVAQRLGVRSEAVLHAGGARTLDEDMQTVGQATAGGGERGVLILVKAWEPPVMEFVDFVRDLRKALGDGQPIVVVPVALDAEHHVAAPEAEHERQWRKKAQSVGDPWLSVRPVTPEGAAP